VSSGLIPETQQSTISGLFAVVKDALGLGYCNTTKWGNEVCPESITQTDNVIIPLKEHVVDEFCEPVKKRFRVLFFKEVSDSSAKANLQISWPRAARFPAHSTHTRSWSLLPGYSAVRLAIGFFARQCKCPAWIVGCSLSAWQQSSAVFGISKLLSAQPAANSS